MQPENFLFLASVYASTFFPEEGDHYSQSINAIYTNLLVAECEVRTESYGPSFFPSFYGPSAKRAGHENEEGKNEDP